MAIQYRDMAPMHVARASDDQHNLSNVHVSKDSTAATNGHVLAMVAGEDMLEPMSEPVLIPLGVAKDLAKAVKKDARGFELERCSSLTARASHGGTVREFATIDGVFPNVDAVIPKGAPTFTVGLGIEVLEQIIKVAKHYTGERRRILEFRFRDDLSAFDVKVQGDVDNRLRIIGMPARVK